MADIHDTRGPREGRWPCRFKRNSHLRLARRKTGWPAMIIDTLHNLECIEATKHIEFGDTNAAIFEIPGPQSMSGYMWDPYVTNIAQSSGVRCPS